jgi:hypothetical protein
LRLRRTGASVQIALKGIGVYIAVFTDSSTILQFFVYLYTIPLDNIGRNANYGAVIGYVFYHHSIGSGMRIVTHMHLPDYLGSCINHYVIT